MFVDRCFINSFERHLMFPKKHVSLLAATSERKPVTDAEIPGPNCTL